jgi:hypothetical protein
MYKSESTEELSVETELSMGNSQVQNFLNLLFPAFTLGLLTVPSQMHFMASKKTMSFGKQLRRCGGLFNDT